MAKRTIVGVGCELPGGIGEFVPLTDKASLLDWDMVVFQPTLAPFLLAYHTSYQGKPWLSDSQSVQLMESAEHWRREVSEAVRIGKSVFVLLAPQEQVWIDTGRRQYSGTGRNRQTTRMLEPFQSYQLLPSYFSVLNSEGKELKLTAGSNILSDYWKLCEKRSMYRVLIDSKVSQPLIITRSGSKIAGALTRLKDSVGALVLLPFIDLEAEEFFEEAKAQTDSDATTETEVAWSPAATKFGNQLRDCILRIDDALRQGAPEPAPTWAADSVFLLPAEAAIHEELLLLETEAARLSKRREVLKQRLDQEGLLKGLLYAKGSVLEDAIAHALRLMGFTAAPYRDAQSEFDVVFESNEGRLIGEAEGKDSKPINVDKLRQLQMNLHEDFEREQISSMAVCYSVTLIVSLCHQNEGGSLPTRS